MKHKKRGPKCILKVRLNQTYFEYIFRPFLGRSIKHSSIDPNRISGTITRFCTRSGLSVGYNSGAKKNVSYFSLLLQ